MVSSPFPFCVPEVVVFHHDRSRVGCDDVLGRVCSPRGDIVCRGGARDIDGVKAGTPYFCACIQLTAKLWCAKW